MKQRPIRLLIAAAASLTLTWGGVGSAGADPSDAQTAPQNDPVPSVAGMVIYKSAYPAAETITRVQDQLNSIGKVATTVDFARTAQWVEKQLRPTTVIIGGNPAAAAPIMAASQRAAIDLPQKYLVWQAAGGTVFVGYNSADYVASCAGIDPSSGAVDALRNGSASVAAEATGTSSPAAEGSGSCPGSYFAQKTSTGSFADTVSRYQAAFTRNNQPAVATVDQAAAAASAGTQIAPTEVLLTDDASVSVPLVAAQQTMGIDLPLRFLVWQDDAGTVHVGHPDIHALASRHQVSGQDTLLDTAAAANNYLTNLAAGGGPSG